MRGYKGERCDMRFPELAGLVGSWAARACRLSGDPARASRTPLSRTSDRREQDARDFRGAGTGTDRLDEPFDVIWICVKATALKAVPEQELGGGVVVPLLNGIDHVERLRKRYGPERVLPETIRVEAEQIEPGRVRQLSSFVNVQIAPGPATRARAETLSDELSAAGVSCEIHDDEVSVLWGKLCFLAPFALVTRTLADHIARGI